ncbi:MAG: transposase [Candidatus Acidiferrales bacterium]
MPKNLNRKNIRLPAPNYTGIREYFVTICCHKRAPLLARSENVLPILEQLKSSALSYSFSVHASCAMPDHLHILVAGASDSSRLLNFVKSFKQRTGYEFRKRTGAQLWQFKSYDHILRRGDGMERVAWYIWMNPVRKGLCNQPAEFPYSGSFTMEWRDQPQPQRLWNPPRAPLQRHG